MPDRSPCPGVAKEPPPEKGPIVLQSHGSHLWFRNIFIRELDRK